MTVRLASWAVLICLVGASQGFAADPTERNEASTLPLASEMSPAALATTTARGTDASANSAADVNGDERNLHSQASANASIDGPLVIGPATTGDIGTLQGAQPSFLQMSTGIGNIQQGVSAVAVSQ